MISRAEKGKIYPFHDSDPDILIYLNDELRYFISYSRTDGKFRSWEIDVFRMSVENMRSELKGKELKSFLSVYKGEEEIFPFHHRKGVVRGFHDGRVLRYLMYAEEKGGVTKWYKLDYRPE